MDAAFQPIAATMTGADLWAACEERAVVRLTLASGQVLTGHYTSRAGLHFLHRTGRDLPLKCLRAHGRVLRHGRRGVQADLFCRPG